MRLLSTSIVRQPVFHGQGGTLFGIHVVNVLVTLVTVGVYYFWAKTRVRRYIYSQTAFEGDRFHYHGTGWEIFIGFLKALLIFGLPLTALTYGPDLLDAPEPARWLAGVGAYFLLWTFTPVAIVGARRYRLSRSSWRGIRLSFRGRVWDLIKIFIKASILSGFTFGLYYPFFVVQRQEFLIDHSYFGSERFQFNGEGRDLFGPFLLAVLLTLPTLGLCWFWYVAKKRRYFWDNTWFGAARFHATVTGGALLWLWLVNAAILVFTLGLAWPWVKVRNIEFAYRYLTLEGPLDLERIQQEAQFASATGEGLAGFFDSGFDLG
ncbi:MAG TPA: YjgN family protein [Methylomirabilota bacterium]|nr:YjgN family protein [Methylomirabilota bacterium]